MQTVNIIHASKRVLKGERFTLNYTLSHNEGLLIYITEGKGKAFIGEKMLQFKKDMFLLHIGTEPLSYRFLKSTAGEFYFIRFQFEEGSNLKNTYGLEKNAFYQSLTPEYTRQDIQRFIREFIVRPPGYEENLSCLFNELLYTLSNSRNKNNEITEAMYQLAENINENFMDNDIDVNKYAESAGLSKDRFSVLFKKHFGYPPYKYQLMLKIDEAMALLVHSDLSVKKISDMLGFSNQLYFSSAFKKYAGMSPSDFRKGKEKPKQGIKYR